MTTYTLRSASPAKTRADAVVVGLVQARNTVEIAAGGEEVAAAYGRKLRPLLAGLGATGKPGEVTKVPTNGVISSPLVVFVGMGRKADLDPAGVRRAAGVAARSVANAASVALALPGSTPAQVRAVVEGFDLGGYTFTTYKQKKDAADEAPSDVVVLSAEGRKQEVVTAFEEAQVVAAAVADTRDWVNLAPGDLRPPSFADAVQDAAKAASRSKGGVKGTKVKVVVHDEKALAELGCGGILGVGQGSAAPPRLVELTYAPRGAVAHLALVGKGITFDSGGLSIKPANSMHTMKCDMAGAAAVVQATIAIARLGLPVKVSTFAPMAENMVSGNATRPGDVLTMYGGRTVEVLNTDAEGRLVLADALVRATEQKPDVILDVATLTGHMVVALGERIGGVLGSEQVVADVIAAGESAGEAHWAMPITDEVAERVKGSKIADLLQHDWVRYGGGLYAAAFLREFTDGIDWAHLDIAGPAFNSGGPSGHWISGGTGFAVATLVDFARALAASKD
ncbi:leucyl aminopeptidase [Nocardioides bigeumensis]|uniref:Probable cytosol aminopeptidase n=1 Tax=Nocardioides bigeumensis TaxID=433657 RepID=A0ABP5JDH0_9ACTN